MSDDIIKRLRFVKHTADWEACDEAAALLDDLDFLRRTEEAQYESLMNTWKVLERFNAHPGRTDDPLHDCVEVALKARDDNIAALLDRLDKAERENERLRQLERSVLLALPGVYYMDPSDGGDVQMDEQLRRMAKDAARYRWLRGDSCPDHSIRWTQWEVRCWRSPVWSYDLRRQELDQAIDDARGVEQPEGKE